LKSLKINGVVITIIMKGYGTSFAPMSGEITAKYGKALFQRNGK